MTDTAIDLASLLCSRLCHDMLSPVGALSNGLELLAEERDPEMRKRCMELLEQSARISADKLKFFRLAFGAAGGFGESVPVEEPRALTMRWRGTTAGSPSIGRSAPPRCPRARSRCCSTWPISVSTRWCAAAPWMSAPNAAKARARSWSAPPGRRSPSIPSVGKALDGSLPPAELSSRTAPAWMLHQLAQRQGGGLQFALTAEALVMGAVLPEG